MPAEARQEDLVRVMGFMGCVASRLIATPFAEPQGRATHLVHSSHFRHKKTATPIDRPKNRGSRWVWPLVTVHEGAIIQLTR
jgi:hypothetical protein